MRKILMGVVLLAFILPNTSVSGQESGLQSAFVQGTVMNQPNRPIPGLRVYLVHPTVGRSAPYITDHKGQFFFLNVPAIGVPYYLEIYWGKELIYRKKTRVLGGKVQLPAILLQPLRSKPALLSRNEIEKMIREKGFHHPSDSLTGTFRHEYEARTLAGNEQVVIDNVTGLMWQKSGSPGRMTWEASKKYVAGLNRQRHAGFTNWRVPTVEELTSLLETGRMKYGRYFIDPVFSIRRDDYWSVDEQSSDRAWEVEFDAGKVDDDRKRDYNYVRAVRSIQLSDPR